MLNHPKIKVSLQTNALDRIKLQNGIIEFDGEVFKGKLIYTGMLDQLFNYQFGALPYRSLRFEFEQHPIPYFQTATTVNHPNEATFTRITEFKHIAGEKSDSTSIVTEYPQDYNKDDKEKNIPYYPVFTTENQSRFDSYLRLAKQYAELLPLGRLAEYKYLNMDDAVLNSLSSFFCLVESYDKKF